MLFLSSHVDLGCIQCRIQTLRTLSHTLLRLQPVLIFALRLPFRFQGLDFTAHRVNLQGADLSDADLQGANLWTARLQKADLSSANLQGTQLDRANLQGAQPRDANLQGANLWGADLQGANLRDANLQGAELYRANLQRANLWGADLQGTNLEYADLQEAEMVGTNLELAKLDETTTLPDGTRWTPDTDLARFTDPDHPNFWRSDDRSSPAYRGEDEPD